MREVLYGANRHEFMASHLPHGDIVVTEQSSPSIDSHGGIESSPCLSISQRILAQCYPHLTTSSSTSFMRSYLEQDLLANGTSQRDADIIITSLAHSLDSSDLIRTASSGGVFGVCAGLSAVLRGRYPSALRGAPWAVRAPAFVGHALFLGFMYGAIVQAVGAQDAAYADLVQDKRTVAAVLRAKFRQELEAGSSK